MKICKYTSFKQLETRRPNKPIPHCVPTQLRRESRAEQTENATAAVCEGVLLPDDLAGIGTQHECSYRLPFPAFGPASSCFLAHNYGCNRRLGQTGFRNSQRGETLIDFSCNLLCMHIQGRRRRERQKNWGKAWVAKRKPATAAVVPEATAAVVPEATAAQVAASTIAEATTDSPAAATAALPATATAAARASAQQAKLQLQQQRQQPFQ